MIKNPVEKKIYDYIMSDIMTNGKNYSTLTNTEICFALQLSPFSVRDKVIKIYKANYLVALIDHWDENNNYFNRKLLKGNVIG
jgi:hypothetical protein